MPIDDRPFAPLRPTGSWHRRWPAWCAVAAVAAWLVPTGELVAQRTGRQGGDSAGLWASDSGLPDGRRLLLVVDPATRHAAVYHVDPDRGTLTLRSARDISWDLMVEDFNAQEPKPAALRNLLQTGNVAPAAERPAPGR
ncbi:MAG: hypothetical protein ACKO40_06565 [Planctomycetaceae bacterium]